MDFHCHLDLYPNAKEVYSEALKRTDFTWLVTTSPRAYAATSKVLPATGSVYISPGLHPEVAYNKAGELDLLLAQIETCTGVGEIGLDGSRQYAPHFGLQKRIFTSIIERCVTLGGRVLSIHSRAAASEVLDVLEENQGFGVAVLHWFTDSPTLLSRAVALDCWFSVGPVMLSSTNGRKLAALMPRDRVVAESDGPFAKVRGTPVMPWEAGLVGNKLALEWGVSANEASIQLNRNGRTLSKWLCRSTAP